MESHANREESVSMGRAENAASQDARAQNHADTQHDQAVKDLQRHQEANAAFWANSQVAAATPRQSVWRGGNPLATNDDEAELPAHSPTQNVENKLHDEESTTHNQVDYDAGWRPSLSIGSIKADRLSTKEAARRWLLQLDHILEHNRVHHPHDPMHGMQEQRAQAKERYEEICARNNADDLVPRHELRSYQQERIDRRVAVLREALAEAEEDDPEGTEPMRKNMAAALEGYASGAIGFSNTYTLIYAGHIVNTSCTSYAEFTEDRQERLDQYYAQHGAGYLWYEPPLASGKERVSAKKATSLGLVRDYDPLADKRSKGAPAQRFRDDTVHFEVRIGFRKDNSLRCRKDSCPQNVKGAGVGHKRDWEYIRDYNDVDAGNNNNSQRLPPRKRGRPANIKTNLTEQKQQQQEVEAPLGSAGGKKLKIVGAMQPSIPTLRSATKSKSRVDVRREEDRGNVVYFDMLLDSGSEMPLLLHEDLLTLGLTRDDMNGATIIELNTAGGGQSRAMCFDLLAGVDLNHGSPESPPDDGYQPEKHFFPTRVIKLSSRIKAPPDGAYSGERLSGMLPFLACYISSAPGQEEMWIGDERADVLGMQKLPPGLRYDPFRKLDISQHRRGVLKQTGGPPGRLRRVMFEHDAPGGQILVDRDNLTVNRGGVMERKTTKTTLYKNKRVIATWEIERSQLRNGQWRTVGH